jgi:hypothetical protein
MQANAPLTISLYIPSPLCIHKLKNIFICFMTAGQDSEWIGLAINIAADLESLIIHHFFSWNQLKAYGGAEVFEGIQPSPYYD